MCDKNSTHILNFLNHFCDLKNLPKTKFCIFQNLDFLNEKLFCSKLIQIQKHDIETTLKHITYGYNPIYMKYSLSMFF